MNVLNKTAAVCLSAALFLAAIPLTASAGETTLTFAADKTRLHPGEQVTFSIAVDGLPQEGWNLLDFSLDYDSEQLVLQTNGRRGYYRGEAMPEVNCFADVNYQSRPAAGMLISSSGATQNGNIMQFVFRVAEDLPDGTTVPLTLTLNSFCRNMIQNQKVIGWHDLLAPHSQTVTLTVGHDHDWGDWTLTRAPTLTEEGEQRRVCSVCGQTETRPVSKTDGLLGDVDGDGAVTAADALLTLQAATQKVDLSAAQRDAAQVDDDPQVTAADALAILQRATDKIAVFRREMV